MPSSPVFPCQLHLCCTAERYFGLGPDSSWLADGVNFPLGAPPTAVSVMVRALYHYTLLLRASQERLLDAKKVFKSALAAGRDTAPLAKELSTAEMLLAQDKKWFGDAIQCVLCQSDMMRTPGHLVLFTPCGNVALDAVGTSAHAP